MTNTAFEKLPAFNKGRLIKLFREYAYKRGSFPLASGKTSTYYFNSKSLLLLPEGAYLAARALMEKIRGCEVDAIGGAGIGAAPITGRWPSSAISILLSKGLRFLLTVKNQRSTG